MHPIILTYFRILKNCLASIPLEQFFFVNNENNEFAMNKNKNESLISASDENERNIKAMKCLACGKSFANSINFKNHLRSHFDADFQFCHICGVLLSSKKLKKHLECHVEDQQEDTKLVKIYSCRYCGLAFDKSNNRTSHEQRIHKDKKGIYDNFRCAECHSIFLTQEQLREHSFEHFNGKIHCCDFPGCLRYFKKGKLLTIHKRCHYEPQVKCLGK